MGEGFAVICGDKGGAQCARPTEEQLLPCLPHAQEMKTCDSCISEGNGTSCPRNTDSVQARPYMNPKALQTLNTACKTSTGLRRGSSHCAHSQPGSMSLEFRGLGFLGLFEGLGPEFDDRFSFPGILASPRLPLTPHPHTSPIFNK